MNPVLPWVHQVTLHKGHRALLCPSSVRPGSAGTPAHSAQLPGVCAQPRALQDGSPGWEQHPPSTDFQACLLPSPARLSSFGQQNLVPLPPAPPRGWLPPRRLLRAPAGGSQPPPPPFLLWMVPRLAPSSDWELGNEGRSPCRAPCLSFPSLWNAAEGPRRKAPRAPAPLPPPTPGPEAPRAHLG